MAVPSVAQAQVRDFDIRAQPASSGVRELAKQAGIQITLAGRDGDGRRTNAVSGKLDVREALERLLAGSGLAIRSFDGELALLSANEPSAEAEGGIVVTGSRIARSELTSAMPISTTKFEDLARIGRQTVYDALRLEPAIAPGSGAYSSSGTDDNAGAAYINLRNLGTNRSLTLIDGRRRVSGTATASAVDINMIPAVMVDRIEVVTGGAAAIYGADAVTGAVNIITKKNFNGLEINAFQGISQHGDAPETQVSLAAGGTFADGRGSVAIGGTYRKADALFAHDRALSRQRIEYLANPQNKGPTDGIPDNLLAHDVRYALNATSPMFYIPASQTQYIYDAGAITAVQYGRPLSAPGEFAYGDGGSNSAAVPNFYGPSVNPYPIRTGEEGFSAIATFDYRLTDGISYSARLDYGLTRSSGQILNYREDSRTLFVSPLGGATAYLDNPYMPESVRALLTSFGLKETRITRTYANFPEVAPRHDRENITISQSLTGDLGRSLKWELYYQWGRQTDDVTTPNVPRKARWIASRDVISDPVSGQPVCRDAAARAGGCQPINIFSTAPLTAAQKAWLLTDLYGSRISKQQLLGANLSGSVFALPHGDLSFAAGAEYRKESAQLIEDNLALSGDTLLGSGLIPIKQPISGSMTVKEVYGELVVPILRDVPFFRRLEIEGAYRYSDYSTVGSTGTWKAGGTWEPVAGLTLRGTYSKSVRVPNFGELFSPVSSTLSGSLPDPCNASNYYLNQTRAANCAALGVRTPLPVYIDAATITAGGNANVKPETSNSYSIGLVFQPRFIRGFDATVDFWNIDIANVITSFTAAQMMNQCVDLPSIDNQFCANLQRGADGKITMISTQLLNASRLSSKGIDLGFSYRMPLGQGQLGFSFKGSYLLQREIQTIPGAQSAIIKYAGGYTDPRLRGYLLISYGTDRFDLALNTQYIGNAKYDPNAYPEQYEINTVPSRIYNDLSATLKVDPKFELGLGVRNLFNVKPAALPTIYFGGVGRYDAIGRYFFTSLKARL